MVTHLPGRAHKGHAHSRSAIRRCTKTYLQYSREPPVSWNDGRADRSIESVSPSCQWVASCHIKRCITLDQSFIALVHELVSLVQACHEPQNTMIASVLRAFDDVNKMPCFSIRVGSSRHIKGSRNVSITRSFSDAAYVSLRLRGYRVIC